MIILEQNIGKMTGRMEWIQNLYMIPEVENIFEMLNKLKTQSLYYSWQKPETGGCGILERKN